MTVDTMVLPPVEKVVDLTTNDPEFRMAARHWTGGIRINVGDEVLSLGIENSKPTVKLTSNDNIVELTIPEEIWVALIEKIPPRLLNDIGPAVLSGLQVNSDTVVFAQYYPAVQRMIELLRPANDEQHVPLEEAKPQGSHDAPAGRYVHITIDGQDYRIYYEAAGQGIPMLLQHTAGSHGTQWRHLFEMPEITDHFRLIAYDLPFHGKSIPPVGRDWWSEEYKLTGEFVRAVAVTLVDALNLKDPIFMGCSVGGVLALDLAVHHPEVFRHVISLEGALVIAGETDDFVHESLWHPKVSNEFKGRLMHSLTAPNSPEAYRRETTQTYMSGWPPAFLGDLHYYRNEFDISMEAMDIDTNQVGVHILNGEYDFDGAIEAGELAHTLIEGSTHAAMPQLGHFPMCEDPVEFKKYLLPILEKIRGG